MSKNVIDKDRIGLKDFREHLPDVMRKVAKGDSYTVYRHSKPVFRIEPPQEETWEVVSDFTKLRKGGVEIDDLLSRL